MHYAAHANTTAQAINFAIKPTAPRPNRNTDDEAAPDDAAPDGQCMYQRRTPKNKGKNTRHGTLLEASPRGP